MPTRYDVFAELIEKAPCKAKDLPFSIPIYSHLKALIKLNWIKEVDGKYIPLKNHKSTIAFKIIKYCLKNGLDYNMFFKESTALLLKELYSNQPDLRPSITKGNQDHIKTLQYLEFNQFILIVKKRPGTGLILQHQLLNHVLDLYGISYNTKNTKYFDLLVQVLSLNSDPINPFDENIFSFLSGSAQLEGATITPGETRELILNDIYPDKPHKDIQMVKNLNEAMHYVITNLAEDIDIERIKELNKLVMFGLHRNAGKFKTTHNRIHGNPDFKTAAPNEVFPQLSEYCEHLGLIKEKKDCLEKIGYIHNEIQHIHPFADGNSRTTRMILNWMLLKFRLPLLVLKMGCFDEYMKLTKLAKKRSDTRLTGLFHHLLLHESLIN